MSRIKITSQKNILETELFDVKENELEFDNKVNRIHRDVLIRPAVSVFPLTDSYDIYLISQYRYLLGRSVLEATAGFIDKGEDAIGAAKRELKEEIGISADNWMELGKIEKSASVARQEQCLYLVRGLHAGAAQPEETEDIKIVKMPLSEAVEKVMSGEINTASTTIGILMLDKMRQKGKI